MMTRFSLADLTSDLKRPCRPTTHRPTRAQAKTMAKAAIIQLIYALAASLALTLAVFGLLAR